ncbi:MAG: (2Fe-2S)-binding protein [Caldisericia bacterium]|nr:(2Fe-2S)-binding protein [Caldisericia bacterium]
MKTIKINFVLNGEEIIDEVPVNITLLDYLRDYLRLTGTKEGCGKGECGACTVIMNGRSVNSCMVLIPQVDGKNVLTIEGLSKNGITKIQKAFVEEGAIQCGFCTPGMVMSTYYLLSKNPHPNEEEIREGLSGNLCRCTGYKKIIEAVKRVSGGKK